MGRLLFTLIVWAAYFGGAALIMHLDSKVAHAKAHAAGTVDFLDRGIGRYMLLAVVCGPLPLIMYFVGTRKGGTGLLVGIAAAAGHLLAVWAFATVLALVFVATGGL